MIRKALIYSLLILFVTNGKALEFTKIPSLLEHYSQHKNQNAQLSFGDFMFMHYVGDDANDQDNSSDEQLPFKSTSENCGLNLIGIWVPNASMKMNELVELRSERVVGFYDQNYFHKHQTTLFRPPVLV